jgi:hypothetical protein
VTASGAASGIDHDVLNFGVKVPVGDFTLKAQYTESTLRSSNNARLVDVNFPLIGRLRQHEFRGAVSYAVSVRTTGYALATRRGGG